MNYKNIFGIVILSLMVSCVSKEKIIHTGVSEDLKPISPILVGTNVWFNELSDQVWDLTKQSGVKSIRIGGHAYDVQMPSKTILLGWVKKIQAMGAEPIIQVSQYASPEAAADLVTYFNKDLASGKPVKYWNIGNEPWLQRDKPEISKLGSIVENYFKPRALAMKSVDPGIKIYGPDFCYYIEEAIDDLFGGKNDISGKIPGQNYFYCDGISWHRYPQDEKINLAYEGIEDFQTAIIKCKAKVDSVNLSHKRTGANALGWGIGEYNAKGGPQVHTWQNGQMFGGVLNLCMKYEATYATTWSMFEHGGDRKGSDFSFIDGNNMTPRASYRHMQMIADNFSGAYVEGKSSLKDIIVFGALDGDKVAVMIMNRSNKKLPFVLNLNHQKPNSNSSKLSLNVDVGKQMVYDGEIGPMSTQTLVFKDSQIKKIVYTNTNFINEQPATQTMIK